jgi:hypothetical protein
MSTEEVVVIHAFEILEFNVVEKKLLFGYGVASMFGNLLF